MTLRRTLKRSLSTTTRGLLQFGSGGGGAAPPPLLLDAYPGAAAAYSLRKLSNSYSGSAIRVRRASDSAEQDIGFSGNDFDTASLTSFCTGTDGFVTTWYDQSGNTKDATQAIAALQPRVVSGGAIEVDAAGTLPTVAFSTALAAVLNFTQFTATSLFAVSQSTAGTWNYLVGTPSSTGTGMRTNSGGTAWDAFPMMDDGGTIRVNGAVGTTATARHILSAFDDATGSAVSSISTVVGSRFWDGDISEIILYDITTGDFVSGIENDMAAFYGIALP